MLLPCEAENVESENSTKWLMITHRDQRTLCDPAIGVGIEFNVSFGHFCLSSHRAIKKVIAEPN